MNLYETLNTAANKLEFNKLLSVYKTDNEFYQDLTDEGLTNWDGRMSELPDLILRLHVEQAVRVYQDIKSNLSILFNEELKKNKHNLKKLLNLKPVEWCFDSPCTA